MIREDDVASLLRTVTEGIDISTAPVEELARAGRRRVRKQRTFAVGAAVAAVAAVGVGIPLVSSSEDGRRPPPATIQNVPGSLAALGCADTATPHLLPTWARAGFSGNRPRIPFVMGREGDIVAILFRPPSMSPGGDGSNKVLWVSRLRLDPLSPLRIQAHLKGTENTVVRSVEGGPGPSGLELPAPGCWQLDLRWSGHTDQLNLYVRPG